VIRTLVHFVDSRTFGPDEQSLLHLLAGLDRRHSKFEVSHSSIPAAAFDRASNTTLKSMLNRGTNRPVVLSVAHLDAPGQTCLLPEIRTVADAIFVSLGIGHKERPWKRKRRVLVVE